MTAATAPRSLRHNHRQSHRRFPMCRRRSRRPIHQPLRRRRRHRPQHPRRRQQYAPQAATAKIVTACLPNGGGVRVRSWSLMAAIAGGAHVTAATAPRSLRHNRRQLHRRFPVRHRRSRRPIPQPLRRRRRHRPQHPRRRQQYAPQAATAKIVTACLPNGGGVRVRSWSLMAAIAWGAHAKLAPRQRSGRLPHRRWARPRCHHHSRLRRRRSTAATPHRFTDCCLKMPAVMDGRARRISFTTRHPLVSLRPTTQTSCFRARLPPARPSGSISAFPTAAMRSCWAGGARTASSGLSLWTSMAGIFKTWRRR